MSEISVSLHIMEKCWKNLLKYRRFQTIKQLYIICLNQFWLKSFVKLILNFKSFGSKQIKSNQANKQMR